MASGLRWTEEMLEAHRARAAARPTAPAGIVPIARAAVVARDIAPSAPTLTVTQPAAALPPLPVYLHEKMNSTERAYAMECEARRQAGQYLRVWFQPLSLRLGESTHYVPDFMVQLAGGAIEIHEVKGFWRDDARAKIKIAAALFPCWRFLAVQKLRKRDGGGWKVEHF